jgi:hypothetical protein
MVNLLAGMFVAITVTLRMAAAQGEACTLKQLSAEVRVHYTRLFPQQWRVFGPTQLKWSVAGFPPQGPGSIPRGHVRFVVGKAALEQVFSGHFSFPCQFSSHRLLHTHHVGQTVAHVPSAPSLTPPHENYRLIDTVLAVGCLQMWLFLFAVPEGIRMLQQLLSSGAVLH